MLPSFCSCLLTGSCFSWLKSGGGWWRGVVARHLKLYPAKPNLAFLVCVSASPQPPATQLHSSRRKKPSSELKKGWIRARMHGGRWDGSRNLCYPSWLWKKRMVLRYSGSREQGWGTSPPFHLLEEGCVGEWDSTVRASPFTTRRLRGNHDSRKGGIGNGGSWLNHPYVAGQGSLSLGAQRGACWLLLMEIGKRSAGQPVKDGASWWGWMWGKNWTDADGRRAMQMPTCSLLHAMRGGQVFLVPTWSPRQCLRGISSLLASTILHFSGEQHSFLKGIVILISCSMGWSWWRKPAEEQAKCTGNMRQSPKWVSQPGKKDCHHKKPPYKLQQNHRCWPHGHILNRSAALAQITAALFNREKERF